MTGYMSYKKRIETLIKSLKELSCDALLVDDPINLYYLTGLQLSLGILLVHQQGAVLLVDSRYYELCKQKCPVPVLLADQNHHTLAKLLANECSFVQKIAFSVENTTFKVFQDLQACINAVSTSTENKKILTLMPLSNPVKKLRSIKDHEELRILREASNLGSLGYDFVCSLLKEGITETDIAIELEIFWKRRGSKSIAFEPIIAFGANSSMPHYRAGIAKLKKGDCILIDIGVNFNHYHSDMTRMAFFGEPNPKILEIYEIVKSAQKAALQICRPGTLIGDLDQAARSVIASHGYGDKFTHSLGHGVGLEIHEWPTLRNATPFKDVPLQEGMVITIEPGIYLPGIGGVRLEDTIAITDISYENLTNRPL